MAPLHAPYGTKRWKIVIQPDLSPRTARHVSDLLDSLGFTTLIQRVPGELIVHVVMPQKDIELFNCEMKLFADHHSFIFDVTSFRQGIAYLR